MDEIKNLISAHGKTMINLTDDDKRQLGLLFKPSWLSGLIAITAGLAISFGVIITFELNNSTLQQQLVGWEQNQPKHALTQPGQSAPGDNSLTLQETWPLLLLWSFVGLLVYVVVAAIIHDINQVEQLKESLNYVNARPRSMLTTTAEHLLLRLIATAVTVVFAIFIVRHVVPYCITVSNASAADFLSLDGGLYALLSFGLLVFSLHAETILLRLSFGRARVFPGELQV